MHPIDQHTEQLALLKSAPMRIDQHPRARDRQELDRGQINHDHTHGPIPEDPLESIPQHRCGRGIEVPGRPHHRGHPVLGDPHPHRPRRVLTRLHAEQRPRGHRELSSTDGEYPTPRQCLRCLTPLQQADQHKEFQDLDNPA
ncbi:MAG: hypothetical protein L0I76_29595, partial [Pseudonocardia sp.]|nr:hypothetical protein [Pseudonocardia sp.]